MKVKFKVLLSLAAVALVAAGCAKSGTVSYTGSTSTSTGTPAAGETGTKLSDEPYANSAYLVTPGNLSPSAALALTGFNLSQETLPSGDVQVTLTATKQGYKTQVLDLKPGYQLYFVEKSLGDDNTTDNDDGTYSDDMAVLVDQNGYVVQ